MNPMVQDYVARTKSYMGTKRGQALIAERLKAGRSIEDATYLCVIVATGIQDDETVQDVLKEVLDGK